MTTTDTHRRADLQIVPLGGLGEFGMNTLEVSSGDTSVMIDAGVLFPDNGSFGVDVIVPDVTSLRATGHRLDALVLTHGHEDHIGGVPYLWDLVHGPVYGTDLTLALLEPKLEAHGIDPAGQLTPVRPGDRVDVGPLEIEFIQVAHSMPGCTAVAMHTPVGTVVHTGDYKFDHTPPDGRRTDAHRLAELGREGVLALLGDSTNVERGGVSGSEQDVVPAFEDIFASTTGKLVVTTFASSLHRIQLLVDLAARFGRKVVLAGRGVVQNAGIAGRLGYLHIPPGTQISEQDVSAYPPDRLLCLVTGSQGEGLAALSRIAVDRHRHIGLEPGDVVVFSARAIPGNRRAIGRVMDQAARRGAHIIHEDDKRVHVSGHGSAEELKLMLALTRPRYFIPVHGEYRYLARHAELAETVTDGQTMVFLVENGDPVCFDGEGAWTGPRRAVGRVRMDLTRTSEVADEVLRDRRHLAGDGVVVLVLAMDPQAGHVVGDPTVVTRGFVTDDRTEMLLAEIPGVVSDVMDRTSADERGDHAVMHERMSSELQRFLRKRSGRRPVVVPVIMEA